MPWQVEQNTGVAGYVIRCVWFKGYIYAFTQDDGVWRRNDVGPWTQVFNGTGLGWYWEDDDALYCPGPVGGEHIHRSEDGVNWPEDIDLLATFGAHVGGWWHTWGAMGGCGDYFYYENHDVGGAGTTYFYRRDLDGNWDMPFATHAGAEGASGRGIIGFGGEVYWTNATNARYWDGTAWSIEATLDDQGGTYLSLIGGNLYVRTSTTYSLVGGYYWRTPTATNWAFLNLPVPDNTWSVWPLCEGEDGETYTLTSNGTIMRIYQQVGPLLNLIAYQAVIAVGVGSRGGVCVDDTGAMYWGTRAGGTIQFFAFVGDYDVAPGGLCPQAMDCDGDGDALYIGVYDTGTTQPLLISVPLPLVGGVSPGSAVFEPGAGNAINVKCTDVGNQLAIAGRFSGGGNDSVQVSDDGGLSLPNDIAPNWGDTAQPLLVDPDDLDGVMVALQGGAGQIMETVDGGGTWTQRNAAVGYGPTALARLPEGDELVAGGPAGEIEYSPNRGQELANINVGWPAGDGVEALEVA